MKLKLRSMPHLSGAGIPMGKYILPKEAIRFQAMNLLIIFDKLCSDYPIISLEDPLSEHDWDGWPNITSKIGNKFRLVGDDFVLLQIQKT